MKTSFPFRPGKEETENLQKPEVGGHRKRGLLNRAGPVNAHLITEIVEHAKGLAPD